MAGWKFLLRDEEKADKVIERYPPICLQNNEDWTRECLKATDEHVKNFNFVFFCDDKCSQ